MCFQVRARRAALWGHLRVLVVVEGPPPLSRHPDGGTPFPAAPLTHAQPLRRVFLIDIYLDSLIYIWHQWGMRHKLQRKACHAGLPAAANKRFDQNGQGTSLPPRPCTGGRGDICGGVTSQRRDLCVRGARVVMSSGGVSMRGVTSVGVCVTKSEEGR